jgi:hypothetical protein
MQLLKHHIVAVAQSQSWNTHLTLPVLFLQRGTTVINTARCDSVTGAPVGSAATGSNAILAFPNRRTGLISTRASKLDVGPAFLELTGCSQALMVHTGL